MFKLLLLSQLLCLALSANTTYIVSFREDISNEEFIDALSSILAGPSQAKYIYTYALKGFAAELPEETVSQLRSDPRIRLISEDGIVTISTCVSNNVVSPDLWGLVRISTRDKTVPSDDTIFSSTDHAGEGVNIYVLDTGIYTEHEQFGGRATFGWKAENNWPMRDDNGHGTHVASTAAGNTFGVARKANLIAVKVLNSGGMGTWSNLIAGIDWTISQHLDKNQHSVINLSLGGPRNDAANIAVDMAVRRGIFVAVAAGNENSDACFVSPASAPSAFTVASVDKSTNERSYWSNWGSCVDTFGPGKDILGAWITDPTDSRVLSGTSMACPHVAGVAALQFSHRPTWTPHKLHEWLLADATKDLVLNPGTGSPNNLLWDGCSHSTQQEHPL